MAWHNLDVGPRGGLLELRCDADECDEWRTLLDPDDFTDGVIRVSTLSNIEDRHNDRT